MEPGPGNPVPPQEIVLSEDEQKRVKRLVNFFLSSEYDREFIAQEIIISAWKNHIEHVSRQYIRNKCSTAYHRKEREKKGNELIAQHDSFVERVDDETISIRKQLVERLVKPLTPFEQKLIWMRFYNDQTLEEISTDVDMRREDVQKLFKIALFKMNQEVT